MSFDGTESVVHPAPSPEVSAETLLRSHLEAQTTNNEARLTELKALQQADPSSLKKAFDRVYDSYEGQSERQKACLSIAKELGVEALRSVKVADHGAAPTVSGRLLG